MEKKYTYKGKSIYEYCREHNLKASTIYRRLYAGKTLEEALTKPVQPGHPPHKVHNSRNINGMSAAEFSQSIGKCSSYLYQLHRQLTKTNKVCLRPDLTIEQLAEEITKGERTKPDTSHYFMKTYCDSKGYNYKRLYGAYYRNYAGSGEMTFKDYIEQWEKDNGKTV